MTAFVIDASAFERAAIPAGETSSFHAPELIDLEVASLLRASVLRGHRDAAAATAIFTEWIRNDVQRVGAGASLPVIWSLRHTITPYDATYVALAMQLGIPLVTADQRLARAAADYCEVIRVD